MGSYLCALDVGTTGVKAGIFNITGSLIKEGYLEYCVKHIAPNIAEQDPEELWQAQCKVLKDILEPDISKKIAAVCMTNQRVTFTPVDKSNRPLMPYIVWSDRRGAQQCDFISKQIGEKQYYNITGLLLDPTPAVSKILWLKENRPEIYSKIKKLWQIPNMHMYRMGVKDPPLDPSNAGWFGFLDVKTLEWNNDLLGELGISKDIFPHVMPTGSVVGRISAGASRETGLAEGTPIVLGGGDQQVGSIGCGVIEPGVVSISLGTAAGVMGYFESPIFDEEMRYYCQPHAVPGAWEMEMFTITAGGALRWYRDHIGVPERDEASAKGEDPYDVICRKANSSPPGSNGIFFVPTMSGGVRDPLARGALIGLTLAHERNDLARSVLEGIIYELKDILDRFRKGGFELKEVRATGGGVKSDIWAEIQSNIFGVPVLKPEISDAPLLGCMFLAGIGAGIFSSFKDFVEKYLKIEKTYYPDARMVEKYQKFFLVYQKILKTLSTEGIFKDISEV